MDNKKLLDKDHGFMKSIIRNQIDRYINITFYGAIIIVTKIIIVIIF